MTRCFGWVVGQGVSRHGPAGECHHYRMPDTRVLFFDVFGTLVDWRGSLLDEAADLGARTGVRADWAAVVDDWRRAYQPALHRARAGKQWRDLDALQHETLAEVLRLRSRFRTATLSNGHVALLVDLFRFADLRVDAILSAQLANTYKPDPPAYSRAVELLGCEPGQAAMVAAHGDDLVAAAQLGLRPIFVCRPQEWGAEGGPGGGGEPPIGLPGLVIADDLEHLADLLGC